MEVIQANARADSDVLNRDEPTWYKDAIIYQLHVKSFFDSDHDGIGDFRGLIEKLDYISALGVNTIWLLPFYPSPLRDDGYDIADYFGVHEDYGTIDDVKLFIEEAHSRGLRIITELVVNHTSDQHPWFQRARHAEAGSPERDFYVWSDTDQKYSGTRIIFLDTEKSNWAWDPVAQSYYWHRFYTHQPDLNFDNPNVVQALLDVMNYWFGLGVDGLRLDAVPYLVEREGTNNENLPETHQILKIIRAEVDARFPDRLLLAEANQWPEDTQEYFGQGDECHMAFHFPLMPRIYMAIAQEDRFPITDILRQTPELPDICQWAIFLRNHDELTLEMVTDKERDYLWDQYASDTRARLNLGIRRRLTPLMQKDRRRLEMLHSLLLSMPGTPILYYGDEIGMGDNIFLGDRDGVRTPMQWSPDRNGGFSKADPARLILPTIMDPLYGYSAINVESQIHAPHSFLNWLRLMLEIRKRYRAFGRGSFKTLYPSNRRVLAYLREYGTDETILCLANMSHAAQAVELDLTAYRELVPLEMSGGSAFPPIGELPYLLTLPPYGFYWFLLTKETEVPEWHSSPPEPMPEYLTLVLRGSIEELFEPPVRELLERDVLPRYLPKRRWFAAKDAELKQVAISSVQVVPQSEPEPHEGPGRSVDQPIMVLVEVEVSLDLETQRYQLPLTVFYEDQHVPALAHQLALARVRRKQRVGVLTDATCGDALALRYLSSLAAGKPPGTERNHPGLVFEPSDLLLSTEFSTEELDIRVLAVEQSNSSVVIGEQAMLKIFRRLFPGPHPEVEIGRVLTEGGFNNTALLLGHVYRLDDEGEKHVLAVLQSYIASQGNGWEWILDKLDRINVEAASMETLDTLDTGEWEVDRDSSLKRTETEIPLEQEGAVSDIARLDEATALSEFERFATALGTRLGEMHQVLAKPSADERFSPCHVSREHCLGWKQSVISQVDGALRHLTPELLSGLDQESRDCADKLVQERDHVVERIGELASRGAGSLIFRIHGDLHLGQILVYQNDAYFIDFEGEPARPLAERCAKASPFRDVAGILRSFQYICEVACSHSSVFESELARTARNDFVVRFRKLCTENFLQAYGEASADIDHHWDDEQGVQSLIDLFTIEKAAYEISYEAANRPSWVGVPLKGFAEIVESPDAERGDRR